MIAGAVLAVLIIPPMLSINFLAVIAFVGQAEVNEEPRKLCSKPSPPPIWMIWIPVHWLTLCISDPAPIDVQHETRS